MDPIKRCRERIGKLLLIYSGVILLLVVMGGGNLFFAFASGGSATLTDRILHAALPLFMWLYSQKAVSIGDAVSFYAFLEATQTVLLGVWIVLGAPFLSDSPRHGAGMILFVLIASFVCAVLVLALLVSLFRAARKLVRLQEMVKAINKEKGIEPREDPWYVQGGIICLMVLCYLAPGLHLSWSSITGMIDRYTASEVKVYDVGSYIAYMAGSPDGNLLALGTEKGLYVWDTRTRECVWSDDCLAVQRVRFSPGGRYLAAAGRGRPDGASDLAVYEVDGFRRLPGFDWPEHEEHKEKVFHDLMFRPDEETLLILWHRSWIWNRMSQGWDNDEAEAVKEREKELGHYLDTVDLFCTEGNMKKRTLGPFQRIRKGLSIDFDLCVEGSAYFAPDASCFIYPIEGIQKKFNQLCLMNTGTWKERLFYLNEYRLNLWGIKPWYEWRLNADGTRAYLLCRKGLKEGGYEGVLLELDLHTGKTRELESWGWRLALSPDGRCVVMLSGSTNDNSMTLARLHFLDVNTGAKKRILRKFLGNDRDYPLYFVWLKPDFFAISMEGKVGYWGKMGSFIFIDLKEGEGK